MTRLVLLDRDGTINEERNYLSSPDELELLPGAAEGIRRMRDLGLAVVVVTNQSGVGRGYFTAETVAAVHQRLGELLAAGGAKVDAFYVCPHTPDDDCDCRKPAPGLARQAAAEFQADLSRSFVVGDKVCDIELGQRAGATTILVRTGYGAEHEAFAGADYVVDGLPEAAQVIERLAAAECTDA